MYSIVQNELERYSDVLAEKGFSDLKNIRGKRLRQAMNIIKKYKQKKIKMIDEELDKNTLQYLKQFI